MTESNAPLARPGTAAAATTDRERPTPPRAPGSPLGAELDAMQQANRDLLAVAREFEDLRDKLDRTGMVDATVDGVRVPFPAATVLAAKRAELSDRWERMEATALRVREAIRSLLEQTDLPTPLGAVGTPRAHLLNVVAQAMSEVAGRPASDAAGGVEGPVAAVEAAPAPDLHRSAADIASRFAPASARVRIPGDPLQAPPER